MNTHRIRDHLGRWHRVARSVTRPDTWVQFSKSGDPLRLWLPGKLNLKTMETIV